MKRRNKGNHGRLPAGRAGFPLFPLSVTHADVYFLLLRHIDGYRFLDLIQRLLDRLLSLHIACALFEHRSFQHLIRHIRRSQL